MFPLLSYRIARSAAQFYTTALLLEVIGTAMVSLSSVV
jgi:hypothetical protein